MPRTASSSPLRGFATGGVAAGRHRVVSSSPLRGFATGCARATHSRGHHVLIAPTRVRNAVASRAAPAPLASSSPLRGFATRHVHPHGARERCVLIAPTRVRNTPGSSPTGHGGGVLIAPTRVRNRPIRPPTPAPPSVLIAPTRVRNTASRVTSPRAASPHRPYEGSQLDAEAVSDGFLGQSSSPLRGFATGGRTARRAPDLVLIAPTRVRNLVDALGATITFTKSSSPLRGFATGRAGAHLRDRGPGSSSPLRGFATRRRQEGPPCSTWVLIAPTRVRNRTSSPVRR